MLVEALNGCWTRLDFAGLDSTRLDFAGLDSTRLDSTRLRWQWAGLVWTGPHQIGLDRIRLDWTGLDLGPWRFPIGGLGRTGDRRASHVLERPGAPSAGGR